jgi:hypothetical protein
LVQDGGAPSIVIDTADEEITVTHNFNILTPAEFVAFWNAQGANVYFTAQANATAIFTEDDEEDYRSADGILGNLVGGTAVTVSATFSRTVQEPDVSSFSLYTGTGVIDTEVAIFDTAAMKKGSDLVVELVYFTEDSSEVAIAGTHALRVLPGAVELKASPYADFKSNIINPSQQLVIATAS